MRAANKKNLLDYTYNVYYMREVNQFNETNFEKFKVDHAYFLPEDEKEILLEYASYHLFKWIKRLKIGISRDEVKEYILEKSVVLIEE
jgi:hypothetical protein